LPIENPDLLYPRIATWPAQSTRAVAIRSAARLAEESESIDLNAALESETDEVKRSLLHDSLSLIEELHREREGESVLLPERLSVSTLIALRDNPSELALAIRRPMPRHSDRYAKRGTQFHLWVERYYGAQTLFDDEIFDAMEELDSELSGLQEKWLASEWAQRQPIAIEEGFELVIEGLVLRGRIDAVYQNGERYQVVDWKTGKVKEGEDLEIASLQLAMYRIAYSTLHNIPIEQVSAAFHYVGDQKTIYREDLSTAEEIAALISSIRVQ
jgi:DNA helicase-2/ATP-dependent DNA helicase PcrA